MTTQSASTAIERYRTAKDRRSPWESLWQECYDLALPSRDTAVRGVGTKRNSYDLLFDGTAPDAVDQLAASLMTQLTPPCGRWFGFAVGPDVPEDEKPELAIELERASQILQQHFDKSNFAVEMHQCFLDLVTVGTASLMFEEAKPGEPSAFRFTAVPLSQVVLEEGPSGRLDTTFRRAETPIAHVIERFPEKSALITRFVDGRDARDVKIPVLEAVTPSRSGYDYIAVIDDEAQSKDDLIVLAQGTFDALPFVNFRWLKAPGEVYGRSPVMKALPDIKTANKVVELVLKNASIAVTGIWQVDDDGVINPATIKLAPGTIIPKAVGSAGLKPLEAPGRFDVSELVLEQLRGRIRKALFVDQLGEIHGPRMTATEVLERSAEMGRILGATYGRLQSELLGPLIARATTILTRRGEIPFLPNDGKLISLEYRAPHARINTQQDVQNTLLWLEAVRSFGESGLAAVDVGATTRWLGRALGVPGELIRPEAPQTLSVNMDEIIKVTASDDDSMLNHPENHT